MSGAHFARLKDEHKFTPAGKARRAFKGAHDRLRQSCRAQHDWVKDISVPWLEPGKMSTQDGGVVNKGAIKG